MAQFRIIRQYFLQQRGHTYPQERIVIDTDADDSVQEMDERGKYRDVL